MTSIRRKVVIIGGGITGLTAAYYLQKEAAQKNTDIQVEIIESSLRVGGKIDTMRKDGFIIERGPESFLDTSNVIRNLARDLKIEHEIIQHNDGQTYICVGTHMHKIPSSFMLGGSSEVTALVTSSLISLAGKVRAAGDLFIGKSPNDLDEPIGDFFRRRFGQEVVENLVEPLLAGTFAGDIDDLSMNAMFPQFNELEKKHGSLIKGLLKTRNGFYNTNPAKKHLFYETFQNGLSTLIEKLESTLHPQTIRKGTKVDVIEHARDGKMTVRLDDGQAIEADAIIMTTPFNVAKSILRDIPSIEKTPPMKSATIATVTMAFKEDQIKKYKEALNVFVSRNSDFAITSCTFMNRKWNSVAPDGFELLRIYIGRVGDETIVELSDQEIENTILHDLQRMLGIEEQPQFTVVSRWQQGMPQYSVGHEALLNRLNNDIQNHFPNLLLAGSSYQGISMPGCVKQGKQAAEQIISQLN